MTVISLLNCYIVIRCATVITCTNCSPPALFFFKYPSDQLSQQLKLAHASGSINKSQISTNNWIPVDLEWDISRGSNTVSQCSYDTNQINQYWKDLWDSGSSKLGSTAVRLIRFEIATYTSNTESINISTKYNFTETIDSDNSIQSPYLKSEKKFQNNQISPTCTAQSYEVVTNNIKPNDGFLTTL